MLLLPSTLPAGSQRTSLGFLIDRRCIQVRLVPVTKQDDMQSDGATVKMHCEPAVTLWWPALWSRCLYVLLVQVPANPTQICNLQGKGVRDRGWEEDGGRDRKKIKALHYVFTLDWMPIFRVLSDVGFWIPCWFFFVSAFCFMPPVCLSVVALRVSTRHGVTPVCVTS